MSSMQRPPSVSTPIIDVISGQPLGHLGNLSATSMMVISTHPPVSEAIYQVSLSLPGPNGKLQHLELGIQEQWQETAASPGQVWAGYRIVALRDADAAWLENWVRDQPAA